MIKVKGYWVTYIGFNKSGIVKDTVVEFEFDKY